MRLSIVWVLVGCVACDAGKINGDDVGGDGDGGPSSTFDAGPNDTTQTTEDVPLTPNEDNSSGVTTNDDGDIVLDPDALAVLLSHIWIANSPDGTVSKINTETGVEEARYITGPGTPDPSRTTVGLNGDVVVANRGGSSAVRIHANTETCPDKNSNGTIETSTGPGNVLPWGQDECVLWYTPFAANGLARAAAFDFVLDPDGIPSASVWVGLYNSNQLIRLDSATGAVVSTVDIPGHCPYGMAFDGSGDLWVFSACSGSLLHLDTLTLAWNAIPLPSNCAYGIAVDSDGRVWTAGSGCVGRYDPGTGTWATTSVGSSNRGLAHDGAGSVWVADTNYGVHRIDADSMAVQANLPLSGGGFVGMAVDFHGKVWAVSRSGSLAHRIDPATMTGNSFPTGSSPYTYSDMTGFQLQNAAPPLGLFNAILEGCGPEAQWIELNWDAETPVGTYIHFRARTANAEIDLPSADWVLVATQPTDSGPVDLAAALEASSPGSSSGTFLELEITLSSAITDVTPILRDVDITVTCPPEVN
jgi:sugar lactone lactonase YvrE